MKWMKYLAFGAILGAASTGMAREQGAEAPQDYAWGQALAINEASPWYRVTLPSEVYQQSAWPDLRDVRVFNHQGERVPFSLEKQKTVIDREKTVALRLFPLSTSPVTQQSDSGTQGEQVWLRSPNGYEIKLEGDRAAGAGQSYLLALPETLGGDIRVSQVRLEWDKPAENWQGKASLFVSTDMQEWELLQGEVPLMDVASGNDRLTLASITTSLMMSADGPRYLLLVFNTPRLPITLTGATLVERAAPSRVAQVNLPAWGNRISDDEAQYQWTQPQPLDALAITLEGEGVLPVDIAWRAAADEKWQPLSKMVLFNLNEQTAERITVPGSLVQGIRLTTVNAHLPAVLPQVAGVRDSQRLIFNAQGNAPFILAWGNKAAVNMALPLDSLIPAGLRPRHAPENIPEATTHERIKLGGEARLSAVSPAERASQWHTLLVWGALVLGVGALLWMAWRIWREMQKDRTP